jgi:hypothetical protein
VVPAVQYLRSSSPYSSAPAQAKPVPNATSVGSATTCRYSLSDLLVVGDALRIHHWKRYLQVLKGNGSDSESSDHDVGKDVEMITRECSTNEDLKSLSLYLSSTFEGAVRIIETTTRGNSSDSTLEGEDLNLHDNGFAGRFRATIQLKHRQVRQASLTILTVWCASLCGGDYSTSAAEDFRGQILQQLSLKSAPSVATETFEVFLEKMHSAGAALARGKKLLMAGFGRLVCIQFLRSMVGNRSPSILAMISQLLKLGMSSTEQVSSSSSRSTSIIPLENIPRLLIVAGWLVGVHRVKSSAVTDLRRLMEIGADVIPSSLDHCNTYGQRTLEMVTNLIEPSHCKELYDTQGQEDEDNEGDGRTRVCDLIEEIMQVRDLRAFFGRLWLLRLCLFNISESSL